jgi:hypothetical protein
MSSKGILGLPNFWVCNGTLMGSLAAAFFVFASFFLLRHDLDNFLSFERSITNWAR